MATALNPIKKGFLIKHKLALLIVMPLFLVLFFLFREVESLDKQITSLKKAQATITFLDMLFDNDIDHKKVKEVVKTSTSNHKENTSHKHNHDKSSEVWDIIKDKTIRMFDTYEDRLIFNNLLLEFKESIDLMENSTNLNNSHLLFKKHVESHKKLLMGVEKVYYPELIISVDNHLRSIYQLEWLMFWAQEESIYTRLLLEENYNHEINNKIINQTRLLIQNQELFLERFIAINTDKETGDILLSAFNKRELDKKTSFRDKFLDGTSNVDILKNDKKDVAMESIATRLRLLKEAANKIEIKLINEIDVAIIDFENQKNVFIFMSIIAISLVTLLALHIAVRLTKNLNKVLFFLSKTNEKETGLVLDVRGSDELSHFAKEVKILTMKGIEQNKKILKSKEEADLAKQKAIEASKAKSAFLANMSHEIRTPLNGVIGMLEVLNDTSLTTTQKDYLTTVETSSHLLLGLINDVLDFSKIESGMLQLNPHSTAIRETVYDIAAIVQSNVKEKNIELRVEIEKEVPERVLIDDHRLRQVLMNLMSNAVKFTSKGFVEIAIKHVETSEGASKLRFSVKDSGIGIGKEHQLNIFNSFEQEDDSTTKQYGGTGLGLAISAQIIELMNSEIKLSSEKGLGSCFYFDLELQSEEQGIKKSIDKETEVYLVGTNIDKLSHVSQELDLYKINITDSLKSLSEIPDTKTENKLIILIEDSNDEINLFHNKIKELKDFKICLIRSLNAEQYDFGDDVDSIINYPILGNRFFDAIQKSSMKKEEVSSSEIISSFAHVLVAEDNRVNQKVISLHLKKANCSFEITNNGKEVFEVYKENPDKYDFILMDYMMPVKNGVEATEDIRTFEKSNNLMETPIVALTASIVNEDIQMFYEKGMNDYLQKPFKSNELNEKISNALNHKEDLIENRKNSESCNQNLFKIMIVEDNRINQKVTSFLLSKEGYEYEIAEDGQIAIDCYKESPNLYSLLLMDCMMPNKDGYQATREIRQYEEENNLPRVPIIALTASILDEDEKNCFDSGMNAYIPKPIKKENLLNEINHFLKQK